jgi:hypothetical protein
MNGIGGFELEQATAIDEHIDIVGLGEGSVGHSNSYFESDATHAVSQFLLVNLLIEEPAKLIVNGEHMMHHLTGDEFELVLRDAFGGDGAVDGHGGMIYGKRWRVKDFCFSASYLLPPIFYHPFRISYHTSGASPHCG